MAACTDHLPASAQHPRCPACFHCSYAAPLHKVKTDDMLPIKLLTPFQVGGCMNSWLAGRLGGGCMNGWLAGRLSGRGWQVWVGGIRGIVT